MERRSDLSKLDEDIEKALEKANEVWEVEKVLARELDTNLYTAVFERWKENLVDYLKTPTKDEYEKTLIEAKKNGYKIEKDHYGRHFIFNKKWQHIISLKSPIKNLDKNERPLRDALNLNQYKIDLENAKKSWDKDLITKIEKEFINLLIKEVYKYKRTIEGSKESETSQSKEILKTKEAICAWKTTISESFLEEVWIRYSTLDFDGHSALSVVLKNWEEYYFDPTNYDRLFLIKPENLEPEYLEWKSSYYNKHKLIWKLNIFDSKPFKRQEWERWNIKHVIFNKSNFQYQIELDKEQLKLFPNDPKLLIRSWLHLQQIWKNQEAIDLFKRWLDIDPNNAIWVSRLWYTLLDWRKPEAIFIYKKYLEKNENDTEILNELSETLFEMWNYKEAREICNKIYKIDKNYKIDWIDNLEFQEYISSLINYWLEEIKNWNPNKCIDYFNQAYELDKDFSNKMWNEWLPLKFKEEKEKS